MGGHGCVVYFTDGTSEELKLVAHHYEKETEMYVFHTSDDDWYWMPKSSVKFIKWDKGWSRIVGDRIKEKEIEDAKTKISKL